MLVLLPALIPVACKAPPEPVATPTPVLLATFTGDSTDLGALAERGTRFDNVWPQASGLRPALASVLTGRLPLTHGLTDPTQHALTEPTLAQAIPAVAFDSPVGAAWGFAAPAEPTLTWIHGEDAPARALAWLDQNPEGWVFATGIPNDPVGPIERVPLVMIGPDAVAGATDGSLAGHVDIHASIAAGLELDLPTDGVPLWSRRDGVRTVDARAALSLGSPVQLITRTSAGGVLRAEIPLPPATPRIHPIDPLNALPTDPWATPTGANSHRLSMLNDAQSALRSRQLAPAETLLDGLERREGRSAGSDLLRAALLDLRGETEAALELRKDRYARTPWDNLAYSIALRCLELRRPREAARWLSDIAHRWPDDPSVLSARIRVAWLTGDDARITTLLARLWVIDEEVARRAELQLDLDTGRPTRDSPTDHTLDGRRLTARSHWQRGRSLEAIEGLNQVLAEVPRDIDARLTLAAWHLELGDPQAAIRLLGPVVRRLPDDFRAQMLYQRARADLDGERSRIQALRREWRGRP